MAALSDAAALSAAMAKLDATLAGTADDSAAAQAAALWREVGADATKKRSFPSHAAVMKEVASADYSAILECPFDARRNHASAAATRTLCAHGAVARCRVEFDGGAAYTGLFAGAPECLIRLSTAVAPATGVAKHVLGKIKHAKLFPCVAIKGLRGGAPSGNLLFAGAKTGHASADFFDRGVCTQLTHKIPAALAPAVAPFKRYSRHPLALGLSDWACVDADGAAVADPKFPWCLALCPSATLAAPPLPPSAPFDAFIDALLTVEAGTCLYDVYAAASPKALGGATPDIARIGRVVTTSEMRYSPPDCQLIFKHQAKEEDYALRPDWLAELATPVVCHDGARGTAEKHCGSKFFDAHVAKRPR